MSACSRKALTLLSSVFAISGLGLLGLAVSTDYWLYLEEGAIVPLNQSVDIAASLHSGLWRVCFLDGERTSVAGVPSSTLSPLQPLMRSDKLRLVEQRDDVRFSELRF